MAPPFGSEENRGMTPSPRGHGAYSRGKAPCGDEARKAHSRVKHTPTACFFRGTPAIIRNVFAMITKGRGDTGPCFWTSGALSKSRGLPLLVKVKVKFKFKVTFKVKFKLKFKFKVNFKFKVKVKFRVKFKVKVSSSTSSKSSSSSTSRSRSSSSSRSS